MDATASREPTWDQACQIQGEMFSETATLGGLEVQLVFYRGFGECRASKWAPNAKELLRLMTGVRCRGGQTQIAKVLDPHQTRVEKRRSMHSCLSVMPRRISTGFATRRVSSDLLASRCSCFMRRGPHSRTRVSRAGATYGGAYCRFDSASAQQLRDLLSAVAVYAAGGREAARIRAIERRHGPSVTHQVGGKG